MEHIVGHPDTDRHMVVKHPERNLLTDIECEQGYHGIYIMAEIAKQVLGNVFHPQTKQRHVGIEGKVFVHNHLHPLVVVDVFHLIGRYIGHHTQMGGFVVGVLQVDDWLFFEEYRIFGHFDVCYDGLFRGTAILHHA